MSSFLSLVTHWPFLTEPFSTKCTGQQIAASEFNNAGINMTAIDIYMIDGNKVNMTIFGTISNGGQFAGTLNPFDLSIALHGDVVFGTLPFPSIFLGAYASVPLSLNVVMQITDSDAFVRFGQTAIANHTLNVDISGTASIDSMGLTFNNIPLDRQLVLAGNRQSIFVFHPSFH